MTPTSVDDSTPPSQVLHRQPRTPDRPVDLRPAEPRVASYHEALSGPPRRRLLRRREIVAVIAPAWPEDGLPEEMTGHGSWLRSPDDVAARIATRLVRHLGPGEIVAPTEDGRLVFRLRHDDRAARPVRLQEMAYHCVEELCDLGMRVGLVDLGVGWARVSRTSDPQRAEKQAHAAAQLSRTQRDLQPRAHDGTRKRSGVSSTWHSAGSQIALATLGSVALPFLLLVGLYQFGIDPSGALYWALVAALTVTAAGIWGECLHALEPHQPPPAPDRPAPRASAVIAAYLPNEAETVVETLRTFLAQEYSGGLQVVLAYNTPTPMPVEAELHRLAAEYDDLTVLGVADSTSKAQNVNAALQVVDGEFVGIFDADHHPMPGAFERAWQWVASGVDVVQGHCVIRNGDQSALAKLVAVEFEQIYAVAHPGRAALHGFGIFGGSNGYWTAEALGRIRLRGSFLTEDIEASMRVLTDGGRIVSDPGLISYELAPERPRALWKQRMRWAQGWFQVSCRHLWPILTSSRIRPRQKLGAAYLLGWRELYPWVSLMALPLLGFLAWRDGGLDMTSPMFFFLTLFIVVSGPLQTLVGYRLAAPEIRRHPWWFVGAGLVTLLAYTEAKNLVNRVAHLKQLRGEHQWVVTPRSAPTSSGSPREEAVS